MAKQAQGKGNDKRRERRALQLQALVAVLVVALAVGGWMYYRSATAPGQEFASQGRAHVSENAPLPAYNSSPPTSGPHSAAVPWRVYGQPVNELNQVHNLEHGGILIQYNCDALPAGTRCNDVRTALQDVYRRIRGEVDEKVLLAPYPKMNHAIAATAWRHLETFDTVDAEALLKFARAHVNNAPERVN